MEEKPWSSKQYLEALKKYYNDDFYDIGVERGLFRKEENNYIDNKTNKILHESTISKQA